MSVLLVLTTVIPPLPNVPTPLATSPAPVTMDTVEMGSHAQVGLYTVLNIQL